MTALHALLLGMTEGITEFLPISSTGHLILVQRLLGIESTEAVKSFDIIIQSGAIAAAVVAYWSVIVQKRSTWMPVLAAFVPTAIIGFLLHSTVKAYLLDNVTVVAGALIIGGVLIILFERFHAGSEPSVRSVEDITVRQAFLIGLAQTLAIVPGTSRSAATILGGMLLRIDRKAIVDFSFLLAIPTMAGATALDIVKSADTFSASDIGIIAVGFTVSFLTALVAIRWLLQFIQTHTFIPFGLYRIALACIVWVLILR